MRRASVAAMLCLLALPAAAQAGNALTAQDLDNIPEYLDRSHYELPK